MTCVVQVAKFAPQVIVAEIRRIDATLMVCHGSCIPTFAFVHAPRDAPALCRHRRSQAGRRRGPRPRLGRFTALRGEHRPCPGTSGSWFC
jgi:hypothetical protein